MKEKYPDEFITKKIIEFESNENVQFMQTIIMIIAGSISRE